MKGQVYSTTIPYIRQQKVHFTQNGGRLKLYSGLLKNDIIFIVFNTNKFKPYIPENHTLQVYTLLTVSDWWKR